MDCAVELDSIPAQLKDDDSDINISDVIEVIQTDPDFEGSRGVQNDTAMFNGAAEGAGASSSGSSSSRRPPNAYVKILEQPASKALRFRYECEGRSAGSIPGASSSPENKTYPAIQVVGYQGRAVVVVSCVTKDAPYRPHPHNLVGREGCKRGVCTMEVSPETMTVTFSNLGIQCVKKRDIEEALKARESIRVDPFRTGYQHRNQPTSIDLNAVRLCFQVFLEGDGPRKFTVPLTPVVSEPIYDKKAMSDLVICKLSDCSASVAGGKEIILLCEKVTKEDIQVRFYEERDGLVVWEALGDFQPSHVHKQVAISFRAPRYRTLDVADPVKVSIQLRRPTDGATSEPLPFELLPLDSDPVVCKKRRRNDPNHLLRHLHEQDRSVQALSVMNIPADTSVKREPRDTSPSYGGQMYPAGLSPMYVPAGGLSPQPQYLAPVERQSASPIDLQMQYQFNPHQTLTIPSVESILGGASAQVQLSMTELLSQQQPQQPQPVDQQHHQSQWEPSNDLGQYPGGSSSRPQDLDSQALILDSAEWASLNILGNLSGNLTDFKGDLTKEESAEESMTGSFNQLTMATINDIQHLNSMLRKETSNTMLDLPQIDPNVDLSAVPPINQKRTVAFINHFLGRSVAFLNAFADNCESRMMQLEDQLGRIEASVSILKAQLSLIAPQVVAGKGEEPPPNEHEQQEAKEGAESEECPPETPAVPDADPQLEKFRKMLQVGVPVQAVRLKMALEGFDPAALDL